jgi:malate synthase
MADHPDEAFVAAEFARMREDKAREAWQGFDGTWVADPALVPAALAVFDAALGSRPHQLENKRPDVQVTSENILDITGLEPIVTEQGVRMNIRVAVGYMNEWLGGNGHVALENQLEDVSTAEICRSQIWQWIHHEVTLDNGRQLTPHLAERYLGEELAAMERRPDDHFDEAVEIFRASALGETFAEFLTMPAYTDHLVDRVSKTDAEVFVA